MKEQSLIHIKIDYNDAIQSKKDLLSSERDFIRLLKTMKNYSLLRRSELNTKLTLQKKMKELKTNLGRLHETLPEIKLPDILKKEREYFEEERSSKTKKENVNNTEDLESQLKEIQERLRKLG
jgi:hypothetical protein